ncbi:hypothetical protein MHYP_G00131210 [Metynnis hypsauchen]
MVDSEKGQVPVLFVFLYALAWAASTLARAVAAANVTLVTEDLLDREAVGLTSSSALSTVRVKKSRKDNGGKMGPNLLGWAPARPPRSRRPEAPGRRSSGMNSAGHFAHTSRTLRAAPLPF